jgi:hypothetical protein
MNAYATAKLLAHGDRPLRIRPLVNLVADHAAAADAHARLARACLRFLGMRLLPAAHLPRDPRLARPGPSLPEVRDLAHRIMGNNPASACPERTCS